MSLRLLTPSVSTPPATPAIASVVEKNTFEPSADTPSNATPVSAPFVPAETSRDVLKVAPAAPASARTATQATATADARFSELNIVPSPLSCLLPSPRVAEGAEKRKNFLGVPLPVVLAHRVEDVEDERALGAESALVRDIAGDRVRVHRPAD